MTTPPDRDTTAGAGRADWRALTSSLSTPNDPAEASHPLWQQVDRHFRC